MKFIKRGVKLLNASQKKEALILTFFLLLGVVFEMFGLSILLPAIGLLIDPKSVTNSLPNVIVNFPLLKGKSLIYFGLLFIVLIYILKSLYLVYITWRQNKFTSYLSAELSERLFSGYLNLPYKNFLNRNSSVPISILQNEISSFSSVTQAIIQLFTELSVLLGVLITLLWIFTTGTIFVIIFFGITVYLFHSFSKKKLISWGQERHLLLIEANKGLIQGFGGIKDLKIYNKESYFISKYKYSIDKSAQNFIKVNTLNFIPRYYLELLAVAGLVGIILIMVLNNEPLSSILPSLGIFVAAAFRMIPSVNRIMLSLQQIKYADITFEKLLSELNLVEDVKSSPKISNFEEICFNSLIEIKNLKFGYDNSNLIINNINLTIGKGEVIGIIGTSGSGKSTLIDLVLGLLEPNSGEILVDNFSIYKNLNNWQKKIGYVPQSIFLTDDTLLNNIAFGIQEQHIDYQRVNEAIKKAQLDTFVSNLIEGINTPVGERGVKLSGGQRQRIGIARALYYDPQILILDEATSALDNNTENEVMNSIYEMSGTLTIIIIAHRLTTLNKCNRIIEVGNGIIINDRKFNL
jgi:ABC-type multidrug transport system fused ATPase/permease subunit